MDQKCLSCKKPHPSVCRPAFKCDRCHRRDEAAPEMLELLRKKHGTGNPAWDRRLEALLKRIDGDQP